MEKRKYGPFVAMENVPQQQKSSAKNGEPKIKTPREHYKNPHKNLNK